MPVEFKDYYKLLGVPKTASGEEITKAFRKLARQYHPDRAKGDKAAAEERFKEINEAYEVLGDPNKRRKYDTLGANWQQPGGFRPPPGWESTGGFRTRQAGPGGFEFHFGGTGFSDFFEQFFGGGRGRGGFAGFSPSEEFDEEAVHGAGASRRGGDIEGDILVTVEEALRGSMREVNVRQIDSQTGRTHTQTYRVKIPAGVHQGQRIRLAGRGHTGFGGAQAGDLYLRVKFSRHPDYRVEGPDLYHDLEVAPWEAILGATVPVPTPDGTASLKIPPGTTAGRQFRLRGKGLPAAQGERGDLFVVVTIHVPSAVTDEQRALWEKLARQSHFDPRK